MLFNSIDFAIFLPVIFCLYWFVANRNLNLQNILIVASSYFFYGCWDWRFLSLLFFSSIFDYSIGRAFLITNDNNKRKLLLWFSILINLGILSFFKYFNFFISNFVSVFTFFGYSIQANTLEIILPIGISFYTFQSLSYTIDVYNRKLEPTKNIIEFLAFVSFFPQLVAGPIERAINLLPQFHQPRIFNYEKAVDGSKQILWGLLKKIVIADNCAYYANQIFNNPDNYSGSTLVLGALFFTFQIYCDFSGYSDIAIGTSRLFGFNLMKNFAFPYFSRDIAEFWRRWHISLSTWFRDYLYVPLGGSRGSLLFNARNVFIVFIVSGFWHGANWTFIVWGLLNAIYFLPLLLLKQNRNNMDAVASGKLLPSFKDFLSITLTFSLTVFAWIFFRAQSLPHAFRYIEKIFSASLFYIPNFNFREKDFIFIFILISFVFFEWLGRENEYAIQKTNAKSSRYIRWSFYYAIIFIILIFNGKDEPFIYFQF